MKFLLNLFLFLFALFIFEEKTLAFTDYQIKRICKNDKKVSICIKNLQKKRTDMQKGNLIEIPVLPYDGNEN